MANNRPLSFNKEVIFSSEGCFFSLIEFISDGDREKKATSEAEVKAEINNSNPAKTIAIIADVEGA